MTQPPVSNDIRHGIDALSFTRRLGFRPDSTQSLVLRTDIRRGILNCCRQWGKSTITAVKALHHALFHPDSLALVVAPSGRQSAEFLRKVSAFLSKLGIRPRGDGDNETSLLLPNRARIVGLPSNEHTIRGFSNVTLLLVEEAARVSDDVYFAVRPMLAAAPSASLWLMSTPYGRRGFFYQEWSSSDPIWTRLAVPATDCPRLSPAFLQEERLRLGDREFSQEYLCQFNETEDSVFSHDDILAALSDDIEPLFPLRSPL